MQSNIILLNVRTQLHLMLQIYSKVCNLEKYTTRKRTLPGRPRTATGPRTGGADR